MMKQPVLSGNLKQQKLKVGSFEQNPSGQQQQQQDLDETSVVIVFAFVCFRFNRFFKDFYFLWPGSFLVEASVSNETWTTGKVPTSPRMTNFFFLSLSLSLILRPSTEVPFSLFWEMRERERERVWEESEGHHGLLVSSFSLSFFLSFSLSLSSTLPRNEILLSPLWSKTLHESSLYFPKFAAK